PRTAFADQPLGRLVTLDKIYELVEGNLSTEKQKDIHDISKRFDNGKDSFPFAIRVAKTLCLLEFVRDLPRTETNIAACLVDDVNQAAPLADVQKALELLTASQFIRNTESGWKLQTAQEKNWETERRGFEPKPKDRHEIERETLLAIFSDPKLKTYRFQDIRNFRVGISVNGIQVGEEGQVPLSIRVADDESLINLKLDETRTESRSDSHKSILYWVFALTSGIDTLIANLFASREMVKKYSQLQAQNKITNEEGALLSAEKQEVSRLQNRLAEKLTQAVENGNGIFRGVSKDGTIKKFLDAFVPDLYPKLQMGARSLKGTEAEEILRAANLNGLSQVFYSGTHGLNLVIKDGARYIPNTTADVSREVLDYLAREFSYGNKETRTGKYLETHFGGLGYGWDTDILRLILAVLFRAGAIEISSTILHLEIRSLPQPKSSILKPLPRP
ncbi:MAG: BREX system P-loop protein BrxC, partial [Candidatus Humimicrobiaceae bacterium]